MPLQSDSWDRTLGSLAASDKHVHTMIYTVIGESLSEAYTIVVYGTTCIDRPTDRPCPSHSLDTDTLHVSMLPRRHATLMWTSAVCSGDSYKTEIADNGKAKSETPSQWTARLERERDQRTSSYLRFLVGVAMHPWVSHMSVFLAGYVYFTQTPFHTFLHKHNTCTLHSGQDLRTRNAYGRA